MTIRFNSPAYYSLQDPGLCQVSLYNPPCTIFFAVPFNRSAVTFPLRNLAFVFYPRPGWDKRRWRGKKIKEAGFVVEPEGPDWDSHLFTILFYPPHPLRHRHLKPCPLAGFASFPDHYAGDSKDLAGKEQTHTGVPPKSPLEDLLLLSCRDTLAIILAHNDIDRYCVHQQRTGCS